MTGLRDSELNDIVSAFNLMQYYKKRGVHANDAIVLHIETFMRTFSENKYTCYNDNNHESKLSASFRGVPFNAYSTNEDFFIMFDILEGEKED